MGLFKMMVVGEIIHDSRNTIKDILTNPVGAATVTAVTLGAMYFRNEKRKQDLERRKYNNQK